MISKTMPALPSRSLLVKVFSAALLSAAMIFATTATSSAQVLKRAVQGGLLGAGIGAIAGGGKGAGKGAAIGAAVGAVAGAAEKSNNHNEREYRRRHHRHYSSAPPPPPPAYNDSLVYNIQVSLSRLGYDPGPVDGVYGQRTAEAIRAYEYNNQLPLTGTPSPNLYNHMVAHGG